MHSANKTKLNIPNFPDFTPLQLGHKSAIETITKKHKPYSDFTFTSLFAWNTDNSLEISTLNNSLVIKLPSYTDTSMTVSFIGDSELAETAKTLLEYAQKQMGLSKLELIPDFIAETLEKDSRFLIEESPDHHDYILDTNLVSKMEGKGFRDKRNHLNRFKKHYPNHEIRVFREIDADLEKSILGLNKSWADNHEHTKANEDEMKAIKITLDNFSELDQAIVTCWIKDKLIAYAMLEDLGSDYGLVSFEKADINHHGSYTLINHEQAKYFQEIGCKFVNIEQDLGVGGMRFSKNSWNPVEKLKKYDASLR